jgi:hypothetical protein
MSNLKTKRVQIGDHSTATNNFVMHQSDTPDGKVHISNGTLDDHTSKMTLTHDGKLGVGTDSPGALLSIPAGGSSTPRFAIESATDDNDFTITQYEDGNGTYTMLGQNVKLNSGGNNTVSDAAHKTAGIQFDARNNGTLTFVTGAANTATENMQISSAGYVTTPNQPSFMAVGSSATPSSGSGWPWGSIIHNNGSHFSLATGRFTAPVAGKYMFFATFIGSNSNDVYRYYTRKNNVNYPRPNSQLRLDTAGSSGTDYEYGTSAILMDMAAGDYAAIWFESGGTNSHPGGTNTTSGHEIFSGYLIG